MTRAAYTDLFLIFTPAATGAGVLQATITLVINNIYTEAETLMRATAGSLDTNNTVKGLIIKNASNCINAWHLHKADMSKPAPVFGLTDKEQLLLLSTIGFSFGFASHEDTPLTEVGDGT